MYVVSVPRRLRWYGELLEPLGLRWEFERWAAEAGVSRGARNTPLPPDGWHLLHMLAYERIHGSERPGAGRPKMLHLRAWSELNHAIGDRYRHPAISGVAFGAYDGARTPTSPMHIPVWRDADFRIHPFHPGDRECEHVTMQLRTTWVNGIGQCWHYLPAPEGYDGNIPWKRYDPANPWFHWDWAMTKIEYQKEHPRG